ncbi:bacteriocin immunity protein [Streptomyces collinus]|uniref:hypothetical protein n=1 Tax=Streptomyces collinus TaxID=42684 RepID=UPI003689676E
MQKKSREELVRIVQQLIDANLPEEAENRLLGSLRASVLHPRVSDLIYYSDPPLTADEVIEQALAYRPIAL